MQNKALKFSGILAPIIYVLTVLVGGLLWPGYSHLSQYVSELIGSGAPNKQFLNPLFGLYNLLTLAFAIGLFQIVRSQQQNQHKLAGTIGALALLAEGLFGFLTLFFPQDPLSAQITSTGVMHIVLAGLSSLTTMLAMLLMGFWFNATPRLRAYGVYSFVSVAVVFVFGGLAAATGGSQNPLTGLIERVTIGGFLQWLFVIALKLS
jgi:hypothetical membrane protein